jgi:transcriptional regulator with XRE-family HTH domain
MPLSRFRSDAISAELEAAAVRFGQHLRRWRIAQGWSQNTPQDWGQAVGVAHVFNSQWSQLENARLRGPSPLVFRALGTMNHMLAAGEYGVITDHALRERVKAAQPICHPDGKPWTGSDFWACFTGALDWPAMALPPITDEEAAATCTDLRDTMRSEAKRRSLALGVAVGDMLEHVPTDQRDRLEDMLLGDDYSGAELTALRDDTGDLLPKQWVKSWCTVNIP